VANTRVQGREQTLDELQRENEHLRKSCASLSQQLVGLRMLQHIAQELVSELDLDRLLKRILNSAIQAVGGTAGSLLLLDRGQQDLVFAVVEGGGGTALEGQRMGADQGLAGWVLMHNEPVIVPDVQQDDRFFQEIPDSVNYEVTSLVCVPLVTRGDRVGVVQVLNKAAGALFDNKDLDLLTSFAAQSAAAIENARLYHDLKREQDRILDIEEEVRKRLARDLHDGPAQVLVAIILGIEHIDRLPEAEWAQVLVELDELRKLSQRALRQVRTLLFDLRPLVLETQGLVPALESYVDRQQDMAEQAYHLQVSGFSGRLTSQAERSIFGIVQEAVGNAKKHAKAQNVWIGVTVQDGHLMVGVRDDGVGFDVDQLNAEYAQRGSLGMLNMRERAQAIGGALSIRPQRDGGTVVALSVPLAPLRRTDVGE